MKKHIESLAKSKEDAQGSDEVVFNDSVIHASLIMGCLLKNSSTISMFCGKFSVFRDAFKEKIDNMLKDSFYNNVRGTQQFVDFHPYDDSLKELISFFERGGKMDIVLEEEPLELTHESIWTEIQKYIGKNLFFYKRNDNLGKLSHFAIGDDRYYRLENNRIERTALCSFNDKETVLTLNNGFLTIKSESKKIDFN